LATSTLATLLIKIEANSAQAVSALSATEKRYKALGSVVARLAPVIGLGAIAREVVKNSIESQNAIAQLEAAVRSTGGAAGKSVAELDAYSQQLQQLTTYGDEAVKSAQGLLLTFKEIKGGTVDRATKAVLDMSTAMGQDLKSSAVQVGKALNDPVLGVTALQRVGVQFTKSQRDVINALVETGDVAGAQTIILKELESQFGGSAEAARDTLGGALAFLSNQWGDLFEISKEGSSGIISAINALGEAIPRIREKFDGFVESVKTLVYWYKSVRRELALWEAATTKNIPGMADRYAQLLRQAADLKQEIHDMFNPKVQGSAQGYAGAVGNIAANANAAADALAKVREVSVTIGDPSAVAIGSPGAVNPGLLNGRGFQLAANFKPEAKALETAYRQTTRNLSRYTEQFADTFAGLIASATRNGMNSFRQFADFAIQELVRIGTKRLIMSILSQAAGVATAGAASGSSGGVDFGQGVSSSMSTPGISMAPATVVHQTVNFSVSAIDSRDATRFLQEQKGTISQVVADAARGSSGFRRALSGA